MFKKVVLPTIAISGMIFAGFAMLLAEYGSERIEIRVDNQKFVDGEVRDFLSPGMGAGLNITLGLASVVAIGSGKSASKKKKLEKQLLEMKKAISDKDAQIEELSFVDVGRR